MTQNTGSFFLIILKEKKFYEKKRSKECWFKSNFLVYSLKLCVGVVGGYGLIWVVGGGGGGGTNECTCML